MVENLLTLPIIGFIAAFIFSILSVPLVRKMCLKEGYYDLPGERKIHKKPIPRLGGIAIWLGTIFSLITVVLVQGAYPFGNSISAILVGGTIMFILGMVDDTYGLSAKFKFFVQIGAALITFLLGIKIGYVYIPFLDIHWDLGALSFLITILWVVGLSNAFNFIDGVDGLAGTLGATSAITLGIIALFIQPPQDTCTLLCFILAGAIVGFLVFNYNPARIFMGDSGSLFMGFLLATLSITGIMEGNSTIGIIVPMFILAIPILDITFSSLRRILKGVSPFHADSEHIHHKLLHAGLSQNMTVLTLVFFALCFGAIATFLMKFSLAKYGIYAIIILIIMLVLSIYSRLTAISEKEKDNNVD